MLIKIPRGYEIRENELTSESAYFDFEARRAARKSRKIESLATDRREFMKRAMAGVGGATVFGSLACTTLAADVTDQNLLPLGAARNPKYVNDNPITPSDVVFAYNNFYEFSTDKSVFKHVAAYKPKPWTVEVAGLVAKPKTWDLDDMKKTFGLEERAYRHRCVEAWYMDIAWTGFSLSKLIAAAEPQAKAKFVKFTSLLRKEEMPGQKEYSWYRWPYYEGLRLEEAMNELTLATVGIYGKELPKQMGAPFRVVVPWKYGYKGPKAVVKIELVDKRPATFWNDLQPDEYGFESNVNPNVPHPRWSQASERSIDGKNRRKTAMYNGYGSFVASLYK